MVALSTAIAGTCPRCRVSGPRRLAADDACKLTVIEGSAYE